jgi:hypothetical protein
MMMPIEQQLISAVGWQNAFYMLAGLVVLPWCRWPSSCASRA